jgi:hypothetical protein
MEPIRRIAYYRSESIGAARPPGSRAALQVVWKDQVVQRAP